jgi:hypothetical protein
LNSVRGIGLARARRWWKLIGTFPVRVCCVRTANRDRIAAFCAVRDTLDMVDLDIVDDAAEIFVAISIGD